MTDIKPGHFMRYRIPLLATLAILVSACQPEPVVTQAPDAAPSAEADAFPYHFQAPEDWRSEVVTFPLSFAPELNYEGHGDVRFAPGMFTAGAEDFWTYSFVWWLPADTEISAERLSADMDTYFSGLAALITRANERDLPEFPASATYTSSAGTDGGVLKGRIETLDAFATQSPVTLNSKVTQIRCEAHERKAVLFAFSPKASDHPNWAALNKIRADFRCDKQ